MVLTFIGSLAACAAMMPTVSRERRDPGWSKHPADISAFSQRSVSEKVSAPCRNCAVLRLKVSQNTFLQHLSRNSTMLTSFEK
jgi:hypothetical protein